MSSAKLGTQGDQRLQRMICAMLPSSPEWRMEATGKPFSPGSRRQQTELIFNEHIVQLPETMAGCQPWRSLEMRLWECSGSRRCLFSPMPTWSGAFASLSLCRLCSISSDAPCYFEAPRILPVFPFKCHHSGSSVWMALPKGVTASVILWHSTLFISSMALFTISLFCLLVLMRIAFPVK